MAGFDINVERHDECSIRSRGVREQSGNLDCTVRYCHASLGMTGLLILHFLDSMQGRKRRGVRT